MPPPDIQTTGAIQNEENRQPARCAAAPVPTVWLDAAREEIVELLT
jgi:hypothetical protein